MDWQTKHNSLAERAKHVFSEKMLTDCEFLVGEERVGKFMLALGSPAFEAMFFGAMPQTDGPIEVTDVEAPIFHKMAQFMYEDDVRISSTNEAIGLYNAAKKYLLINLQKVCVDFLLKHTDLNNVLSLYEFAVFHDEDVLKLKCLEEIRMRASALLENDSFLDVSQSTLVTILDSPTLNIKSESELICGVRKWMTNQLKYEEDTNPKTAFPQLVKRLRFLSLSPEEFVETVMPCDMLSDSEKLEILSEIIKPTGAANLRQNGICDERRCRRPYDSSKILPLALKSVVPTRCDGNEWLSSTFTVNKKIYMIGVVLGSRVQEDEAEYGEKLTIKLALENRDDHIAEGTFEGKAQPYSNITVKFSGHIPILLPNQAYTVHTFMCKPGMYLFGTQESPNCGDDTVSLQFVNHTSWESGHNYGSTVLTHIIYQNIDES